MRRFSLTFLAVCAIAFGQNQKPANAKLAAPLRSGMDQVYADETHCLTSADMRGDGDLPISCYCRDAVAEARYVYSTYVSAESGPKDANLNGVFLRLVERINENCGEQYQAYGVAMAKDWKWEGPEVVRTYPSDEVISRIKPEPYSKGGKAAGRWVPFTVQLVYRDAQARITRTENYSAREYVPYLPVFEKPKK